jgi:precorrin-6A/cobalt-precorrin-6A reductase
MILVLAGTRDGRELASRLADNGHQVLASVVSEYGASLAKHPQVQVHSGALDETGLANLIRNAGVKYIVDASHPYAVGISENAMKASAQTGTVYLRFERPLTPLPEYERLHVVSDARQAAQAASLLGKTVFLTTGSRALSIFKEEPALQNCRVIARVLPDPGVIEQCIAQGFSPRDIVAIQGPFSLALNIEMFRFYQADVIVTKNGGDIGGADTKIEAAIYLNLPIVVIDRPQIEYPTLFSSIDQVVHYLKEATICNT